jgi:hypothetical protein
MPRSSKCRKPISKPRSLNFDNAGFDGTKLHSRHFDGRMVFVPEGQHDSSQARSAWNHEGNSPVPAGRLNRSRLRLDASVKHAAFLKRHELSFDDKYLCDGQ